MNKTININLGGTFFHIDESAYQKLKRYLDAIRRSLSDDPKGRDEIIADIEFRIGELLAERVKDVRQVVSDTDIEEIIAVMGQPEDYLVDEEMFSEEDRGSYKKSNYGSTKRKLFRDGDDKFLGGVCSGLAYYFDVDVIWIRIAFLLITWLGGSGIFIYAILWILLPEAVTTAEKLQMEGEPVNISNIEKRVRSEFESASESVKSAVDDVTEAAKGAYDNVSSSFKKKGVRRSKAHSGIQVLIDTLGRVFTTFFKIIGKFIGILLIIISITTLIGLIIGLFTTGTADIMGADWLINDDFLLRNTINTPIWLISLLILILVGIPFLMLFFLGLFILSSRTKVLSRTAKLALLGIWLIALMGAIYIGVKQGAEFARDGHVIEKKHLNLVKNDTLTIKMVDDETLSNFSAIRHRSGFKQVLDPNDNQMIYSNDVIVYFKESDSTEAYIKVKKDASGRTRLIAKENAESIKYDFSQAGKVLSLNGYFLLDNESGYRNQEVRATIYIPKGQTIYLDKTTRSFLGWIHTTNDMYRRDMAGHYFTMTEDGLECLDCKKKKEEAKVTSETGNVKLKIDGDGVEINVKDNEGDKAQVKLNGDGLKITGENEQ